MSHTKAITPITLEQIEASHQAMAKLIEQFKAQGPKRFSIPAVDFELKAGERYAGLVLKADGTPSHHLILLPGQAEDVTWQAAKDWAAEIGGELPTRQEQSLLFANLKAEFLERYHWSCEEYSSGSAWFQNFDDGYQGSGNHINELWARAVRRLIL
jgi:sulfite reductase beta subunit-like hemoprotein